MTATASGREAFVNLEELRQTVLGLVELNVAHAKIITDLVRAVGEQGQRISRLERLLKHVAKKTRFKDDE